MLLHCELQYNALVKIKITRSKSSKRATKAKQTNKNKKKKKNKKEKIALIHFERSDPRDHSFSSYVKFSRKLTFLIPGYANIR